MEIMQCTCGKIRKMYFSWFEIESSRIQDTHNFFDKKKFCSVKSSYSKFHFEMFYLRHSLQDFFSSHFIIGRNNRIEFVKKRVYIYFKFILRKPGPPQFYYFEMAPTISSHFQSLKLQSGHWMLSFMGYSAFSTEKKLWNEEPNNWR